MFPRSITEGYGWKAFVSIVAYLFGGSPLVKALYMSFFVLMGIDLVTGIWATIKEGRTIRSRTLVQRTLMKFGSYALIVIAARMLENIAAVALGLPPAVADASVKVAILYLATAEATSIDENLNRAAGIGLGAILARFVKRTEPAREVVEVKGTIVEGKISATVEVDEKKEG